MAGKAAARATVSAVKEGGGNLAIRHLELTARQTRRAGEIITGKAATKRKTVRRASTKRATA